MFRQSLSKAFTLKLNEKYGAFQFEKLEKFHPRILSQYVPEALNNEDSKSLSFLFTRLQASGYYAAMAYAEDVFIPQLKRIRKDKKNSNSEAVILENIRQIHRYASYTLAADTVVNPSQLAGEYVKLNTVQWMYGVDFGFKLSQALIKNQDIAPIFSAFKVDESLLPVFKNIINKLYKDNTLVVPPEALIGIDKKREPANYKVVLMFNKMLVGMSSDYFSEEEKAVINKFIKFKMKPEEIPLAMDKFLKELVKRLQACDGSREQVIDLVTFCFREFTEIHPFFNANGRTGTILLNSILATFDYPTIIFRTHEDTEKPDSTYNLAFANIANESDSLRHHIAGKLQDAEKVSPLTAEEIKNLNKLREDIHLCLHVLNINRKNYRKADFDIDATVQIELDKITPKLLNFKTEHKFNMDGSESVSTIQYQTPLGLMTERAELLPGSTKEKPIVNVTMTLDPNKRSRKPLSYDLNPIKEPSKQEFLDTLNRIVPGSWGINLQKKLMWCQIPNLTEDEAKKRVAHFKKYYPALEITIRHIPNDPNPLLWISSPKIDSLKKIPAFDPGLVVAKQMVCK